MSDQGAGLGRSLEVVELEVGSRCNRRCSYCPVSLNPRPPVPRLMSDEVFEAVLEQLAAVSFAGRISFHLYNEPLLRGDLERLVADTVRALPDALLILNTNGDLLTDARYRSLRTSGIDYFFVTRHEPGAYADRPFQVVQPWTDLTLTNRGGTLTELPGATDAIRSTPCHAPSEMLIVTVTGDVVLCYEDAEREHVMGNVLQQGVADIWASEAFEQHRRRLERGDRSGDPMCMQCTNVSHAEPGRSALEDPVLRTTGIERGPDAVVALRRRSRDHRSD